MKAEKGDDRVSYQWALRAIGAFLDEHGAFAHAMLETPTGIAVLYRRSENDMTLYSDHFGYEDLVSFKDQLEQRRVRGTSANNGNDSSSPPEWPEPGRYQDVFRAVGWEIDDAGGYNVLINTLDEQMLLSYQFLDPRDNYLPFKQLHALERTQLTMMMQQAYERRVLEAETTGIWSRLGIKPKWTA